MSSRGGGFRGGRGGSSAGGRGGAGGGFRGGRGGGGFGANAGPPDQVLEMGTVMHACEGEVVCKSINTKIPYFNAPIYLENKVSFCARAVGWKGQTRVRTMEEEEKEGGRRRSSGMLQLRAIMSSK